MSSIEFDDLSTWEKHINYLDMSDLPDEPDVPATIPLSELPSSEQARIIWESSEDRWWEKYLPSQPDFGPNHITSPEQLEPGMRVMSIKTEHACSQEIIILRSSVVSNKNGDHGFEYIDWKDWEEHKSKFYGYHTFFADCGLEPHGNGIPGIEGKWNPYNHLCTTGESISQKELDEILSLKQRELAGIITVYGTF